MSVMGVDVCGVPACSARAATGIGGGIDRTITAERGITVTRGTIDATTAAASATRGSTVAMTARESAGTATIAAATRIATAAIRATRTVGTDHLCPSRKPSRSGGRRRFQSCMHFDGEHEAVIQGDIGPH